MAEQNLDIIIRVQGGQVSSAEIKGVSQQVGAVGKSAEETSKKTSGLRSAMTGLATGFAVYKGYQFIKSAVSETVNLAKATAGLQRITGMDTATASGWVGVAKERGIQSKQLNQGFISLAKNIESAAGGSKTSAKAFSQLGLDAANLKVQDSRTQLGMLADSFRALPAGVDKASLARKLFGRQSQALLPLLNMGAKGLNEQVGAEAKHIGMTGKAAQQSMQLAKQQRELNATMLGLKVSIATALLPVLTALAKAFLPIIQAFTKLMTQSPIFRFAVIAISAALLVYVAAVNLAKISTLEFIATAAPWLALAVGIGAALVMLYRHSATFRNALNAVKDAGLAAFRWIKNAAVDVLHWAMKNWATAGGHPPGANRAGHRRDNHALVRPQGRRQVGVELPQGRRVVARRRVHRRLERRGRRYQGGSERLPERDQHRQVDRGSARQGVSRPDQHRRRCVGRYHRARHGQDHPRRWRNGARRRTRPRDRPPPRRVDRHPQPRPSVASAAAARTSPSPSTSTAGRSAWRWATTSPTSKPPVERLRNDSSI